MVFVLAPKTMDREFSMSAVKGRRIEGIWTEQARLDQASDQSHRLLRIQRLEQTTRNLQTAYKDRVVKVPCKLHCSIVKVTLRSSVYLARPLLTVHARLTCGLRPGLSTDNGREVLSQLQDCFVGT